jgi:hypothetical protein
MTVRPRSLPTRIVSRIGVSLTLAMLAAVAGRATTIVFADAVRFTKADSDAFHRKLELIVNGGPSTGAAAATAAKTRQTSISDRELNAYLRHELRNQVPTGVTEPTVTIMGEGRIVGSAVVDLDAVRQSRTSSSWFDPVRLLTGSMPVTATGLLQTQQGTGRFTLESAEISGIPVPKTVLQQVVSYYTRTMENPSGVNLDDPFELPAHIREIRVQPGQAIVVQ